MQTSLPMDNDHAALAGTHAVEPDRLLPHEQPKSSHPAYAQLSTSFSNPALENHRSEPRAQNIHTLRTSNEQQPRASSHIQHQRTTESYGGGVPHQKNISSPSDKPQNNSAADLNMQPSKRSIIFGSPQNHVDVQDPEKHTNPHSTSQSSQQRPHSDDAPLRGHGDHDQVSHPNSVSYAPNEEAQSVATPPGPRHLLPPPSVGHAVHVSPIGPPLPQGMPSAYHPQSMHPNTHAPGNAHAPVVGGPQLHPQHQNHIGQPQQANHVTMQIWVPQNRVGMVIGAHGTVIKTLQERSHATIRVHNDKINSNHKLFTIVGGPSECAMARALIIDIIEKPRATSAGIGFGGVNGISGHSGNFFPHLSNEARRGDVSRAIYVPNSYVGIVIGKGGETIRELQARSGAAIKVTPDKDIPHGSETRSIWISGDPHAVATAYNLVTDLVQEASNRRAPNNLGAGANNVVGNPAGNSFSMSASTALSSGGYGQYTETLYVPSDKVGLIIGRSGVTIRELQERSGAKIQFAKDTHESSGKVSATRTVTIAGTRECIALARNLIMEKVNTVAGIGNDHTSLHHQSTGDGQQPDDLVQHLPSAQQEQYSRVQQQPVQYRQPNQQQQQQVLSQQQPHLAFGNSNGSPFPNQLGYHGSLSPYVYSGFAGDPSAGYSHYMQHVGYDPSDQQAAAQRAQLAYYQQYYSYPAFAHPANAHVAAAAAAHQIQAQLVQQRDQATRTPSQHPSFPGPQGPIEPPSGSQAATPFSQVSNAAQLMQRMSILDHGRGDGRESTYSMAQQYDFEREGRIDFTHGATVSVKEESFSQADAATEDGSDTRLNHQGHNADSQAVSLQATSTSLDVDEQVQGVSTVRAYAQTEFGARNVNNGSSAIHFGAVNFHQGHPLNLQGYQPSKSPHQQQSEIQGGQSRPQGSTSPLPVISSH